MKSLWQISKISLYFILLISVFLFSSCTEDKTSPLQDEVFYFVMPDRFANGSTGNDQGGMAGDKEDHGYDPTDKAFYHGGDLVGLRSKLDYLQNMGITAIWMTPIFKNQPVQGSPPNQSAAHHGYWITDFTQIDPHLGTNQELKDLIVDAHKREIKIFFDIITNHTADIIRFKECHHDDGSFKEGNSCPYRSLERSKTDPYTPFVPDHLQGIKVPAWLNEVTYYHNQGDSTYAGENSIYGDFVGLDDLKTEDPEVVQGMVDIFKFWISEFQIDGFRIDTVKHVNIEFWQAFSPQILDFAQSQGIADFFMFGEVYDARPSFLSQYTTKGKLPSVLDFGMQGSVRGVFSSGAPTHSLQSFFEADDYYNDVDSNAYTLMNFAGNHDMGRLGYFLNTDHPNASEEELLKRSQLSHAFLFFARGIPVVYYGSEQGFTGIGGDQSAREDMFSSQVEEYNNTNLLGTDKTTANDNFDEDHPLYQSIKTYSEIYKQHRALRRGYQYHRYSSDSEGVYAFSRVDLQDRFEYLVAFNSSTAVKTISLLSTAKHYREIYPTKNNMLKAKSGMIELEMAPLSFVLLKGLKPIKKSGESLSVSISNPVAGDVVSGMVEINADVTGLNTQPIHLLKATFEVKIGDGDYEEIGYDWSLPYRVFWDSSDIPNNTPVSFKVSVKEDVFFAASVSSTVDIRVDHRIPSEVMIHYENGNGKTAVYGITDSGGMKAPQAIHGQDPFSISWEETMNSLTLLFESPVSNSFVYDSPLLLKRKQIVRLSSENATGDLIAEIYINNQHDVANTNNFEDIGTPLSLPNDMNAPAPFGTTPVFLRGSLSNWGATEQMSYLGNYTYGFSRMVEKGQIEYKFADSSWSEGLNFGAPFTEIGLSGGGSSGNLLQQIPRNELYDFRFSRVPLPVGGFYTFHRLSKNMGIFDKVLYLRGDFNSWAATDDFAYVGANQFEIIVDIENPGTYGFKIADANWAEGTNFGAAGNSQVTLNTPIAASDGSSENFSLLVAQAGRYRFVIDCSSTIPWLVVTLESVVAEDPGPYGVPLFVKGDMNDWQNTDVMQFKDSFYTAFIPLEENQAGIQLKIADESWSVVNLGGNSNPQDINVGEELTLTRSSNPGNLRLLFSESGVYEFKLEASNLDAPFLTIRKSTDAMVIHYWRSAGDYTDWGLHLWGAGVDPKEIPTWSVPHTFNGTDSFGVYSTIRLIDPGLQMGFIIHKGDEKDHLGNDMFLTPLSVNNEIWMNQGSDIIYTSKSSAQAAQ